MLVLVVVKESFLVRNVAIYLKRKSRCKSIGYEERHNSILEDGVLNRGNFILFFCVLFL